MPSNPYGTSKLFTFNAVRQYREYYGIQVMTAVLFNHESELRSHYFVTKKITKNLTYFMYNNDHNFQLGNIDSSRDWSSAKDFVRCFYDSLKKPNKVDDILLASGKLRTVRDFLNASANYLGIELVSEGNGMKEKIYCKKSGKLVISISPRYYRDIETQGILGDSSKAIEKIGWKPQYSFEDIIRDMIDYEKDKLSL